MANPGQAGDAQADRLAEMLARIEEGYQRSAQQFEQRFASLEATLAQRPRPQRQQTQYGQPSQYPNPYQQHHQYHNQFHEYQQPSPYPSQPPYQQGYHHTPAAPLQTQPQQLQQFAPHSPMLQQVRPQPSQYSQPPQFVSAAQEPYPLFQQNPWASPPPAHVQPVHHPVNLPNGIGAERRSTPTVPANNQVTAKQLVNGVVHGAAAEEEEEVIKPDATTKDQPPDVDQAKAEEGKDEKESKDVEGQGTEKDDKVTSAEPVPPASRIRTMINMWNETKSRWEAVEAPFEEVAAASDKAATFHRHMDTEHEKKVAFEELEIHSRDLKHLIIETDKLWSDVKEDSQQLVCRSPFYRFVWRWDMYAAACDPQEGDSPEREMARKDLKELLQQIRNSKVLETYFRSREKMKNARKIDFEHLWTIFAHGSRVYGCSYMKELQLFDVKSCSAPPLEGKRFRLSCSASDWDGTKFSTYTYDFYIKEFHGEKLISSLDVFPTEFYCNQAGVYDDTQLREQLIDRGRRFYKLCTDGPKEYKYDGPAIVSPSGPHRLASKGRGVDPLSNSLDRSEEYDADEVDVTSIDMTGSQSRVIVDNYAFLKSERNPMKCNDVPPVGRKVPYTESDCVCAICPTSPLQQWRPDSGEEFSADETRLMSLPPRLLGFALKDKIWGQFLVGKLEPIGSVQDTDHMRPFEEELQLEPESKAQLKALVNYHKATSSRKPGEEGATETKNFDIIEGKGQGLAILLHGPPGVGKTLTAETIAIATRRPLLTVSVADIGVDSYVAERRLTDVFEDAARWEAVLLMDEADVFVEERRQGELERNALVSVLLRCLEYYDGIIILTTNRVRSIDGAMQSRINLAIQYHDLDKDQRLAIYKNRLKYIPNEELEDRKAVEQGLEGSPLVKKGYKTNGRQIRNIVTGARGLARSKGEKLALKHLVAVFETTLNFIDSMAEVIQKQRARNELEYEK